jgi:hypothetical protein
LEEYHATKQKEFKFQKFTQQEQQLAETKQFVKKAEQLFA